MMKKRAPYTRVERLILAAIVLFLVNLTFSAVIEFQIQGRNQRLDQWDEIIDEVQADVNLLEADISHLRRVADEGININAAFEDRLELVFTQIEAMYQEIVSETTP